MATYYLIAPGGNINAAATFSSTSGGSAGAVAPTTGDSIICDGNSGAASLNLNVAMSLASFDCNPGVNGPFVGTVNHSVAVVNLTITGSGANAFRLSPGMTWTPNANPGASVILAATGTLLPTTAGIKLPALTINSPGQIVRAQDAINVNAATSVALTLTAGTLDMNAQALAATNVNISGSTARTLTLGGNVTLGGPVGNNVNLWNAATTTNLTFNKGTADIVVLPPANPTNFYGVSFSGGGLTYNNLTLNPNSSPCSFTFGTNATFASVTQGAGWDVEGSSAVVITAPNWTINGVAGNMAGIGAAASGSILNITCSGTFTATYTAFSQVAVAGGGSANAVNSVSAGYVSGITFNNVLTAPGAVATSVWTDLLSGSDFSTPGSVGALLKALGNLQFTAADIGRGTVAAGATLTSIPTSGMTPSGADVDQFANGIIIFDGNVTPALKTKRALISGSTNAANPTLTVSALKTQPAVGDTFTVV